MRRARLCTRARISLEHLQKVGIAGVRARVVDRVENGLQHSPLSDVLPFLIPGTVSMTGVTPEIGFCFIAQSALRKGGYVGRHDQIKVLLNQSVWVRHREVREIWSFRGIFHERASPLLALKMEGLVARSAAGLEEPRAALS